MSVHLKLTAALLREIRADLERSHRFAHERVGFVLAGLAQAGSELLLLGHSYQGVEDEDYIDDSSVGAMMGPAAIRKALQASYKARAAVLHVHMHSHAGPPRFSKIDLRESARFVPNFFNISPQLAHGAVVLSCDSAIGQLWLGRSEPPIAVDRFTAVGPRLGLQGEF